MITNINQAWTSHPNAGLLPVVTNEEPGSMSISTRYAMLVPPRYAPIVINHRLSLKQLWNERGGTIISNGDQVKCAPLLNWIIMAETCHATAWLRDCTINWQ
jgi:hypothetical protein